MHDQDPGFFDPNGKKRNADFNVAARVALRLPPATFKFRRTGNGADGANLYQVLYVIFGVCM